MGNLHRGSSDAVRHGIGSGSPHANRHEAIRESTCSPCLPGWVQLGEMITAETQRRGRNASVLCIMGNEANKTVRFWILLVALLLGGVVINVWDRAGEARVTRRALRDFPMQLGQWRQTGDDL